MLMGKNILVLAAGIPLLISACAKELPPRTVDEFVQNPILLEATMVRCAENRSQKKYDAECVNARDAVNRIAAMQEKARRAELEAQSEQKRQALRRTQEAAAEARRRAAEAQRLREEAAYLGQFDAVPPGNSGTDPAAGSVDPAASGAGTNTPGASVSPPQTAPEAAPAETPADLEAIREELKRRQDESQ
ncbi:MAG TPA: EexN family lipoprotein [Woeseiaceae bacterium]|nr:EexN family lipoprotein [Woeseiaceae bacterium]